MGRGARVYIIEASQFYWMIRKHIILFLDFKPCTLKCEYIYCPSDPLEIRA